MQLADRVILEDDVEVRLNRLRDEYVHKMYQGYCQQLGVEAGFSIFSQYLLNSLNGIHKRLDGQQYQQLKDMMQTALSIQIQCNDTSPHPAWRSHLLSHYYDPMYEFQQAEKQSKILFKGSHQAVHQWLDAHPI